MRREKSGEMADFFEKSVYFGLNIGLLGSSSEARMAELADAPDSKSGSFGSAGSIQPRVPSEYQKMRRLEKAAFLVSG